MKTILIVEDETSIGSALKAILEDEGYQVLTASNGGAGLDCLSGRAVDLVICDLRMPVLGGREFFETLQADERYRAIPFVIMTAVPDALVNDHNPYRARVIKPFKLSQLLRTVSEILDTV